MGKANILRLSAKDFSGAEQQKLSHWLLGTQPTPQVVAFANAQIEGVSEKETRLQEKQWAIEDQINELQKQTYDAENISNQLRDFMTNFPGLDQGERKLLIESLVKQAEFGENKRVATSLRPPFAFGFFSPDLAPRTRHSRSAAFFLGPPQSGAVPLSLSGPST